MGKGKQNAIFPSRIEDYPEWYQQVIKAADLAESSPVRGCMVIKPWGYRVWENIQRILDRMFKQTGHTNAYFPLFIPKHFLEKEAKHVEGFAKECAVVTHHRLEAGPGGELIPAGELEEPYIVRPTSETIIGAMYSKWIQSYRDLPILINQWANVVRWEMRTRLFLRTTEFLWQEGHTAHETKEEAEEETMKMLNVYVDFVTDYLAIPVIPGEKTESERFPGALATYTIEGMMQDRKALQAGTSHFLGQNFAKAYDIKYLSREGTENYAWTTSWGVSTRLIGGLIMTHGDDNGLILPPRIAPAHIVVLPVIHKGDQKADVLNYCEKVVEQLKEVNFDSQPLCIEFDTRDIRGGEKTWSWIKKGIPLWLEIGPRDMENDAVFIARRDMENWGKKSMKREEFISTVPAILEEIQTNLLHRAIDFRDKNTCRIDNKDDFYDFFTPQDKIKPEIHGGFALSHWCGDAEIEEKIKSDLNVTIRCIPLDHDKEEGTCPFTGKPSKQRVIYAKSY
ncbi:MAG: proline--tRNA ligase [Spirochaetales bacterium]|nr:proline--tRNA ligase [Spirochaetales bacterium]